MAFRTGRLAKEEQEFILQNYKVMTPAQMAKKLNRKLAPIKLYVDTNAHKILVEEKDKELLKVLYRKPYWEPTKSQFNEQEVKIIEMDWVEFMKQFNQDVEYSEELQLMELLKLRRLCDRNLYERNQAKREMEIMAKQKEDFIKTQGSHPPYQDNMVQLEYTTLESQIRMCEASYISRTNEYKIFLEKEQVYFRELKSTRDQRMEVYKHSKKDFVGLIKSLMNEEFREMEGKELALRNLATEKERARLSEYHIYSDGSADRPLLNAEVMEEKGEENEV